MSTVTSRAIVIATLGCAVAFTGCGLKGPLTLPDRAANAETRAPAHRRNDADAGENKALSPPDPGAAPANDNASVTPAGQVSGSAPVPNSSPGR
jgi:predicted small lipoprotein YifL